MKTKKILDYIIIVIMTINAIKGIFIGDTFLRAFGVLILILCSVWVTTVILLREPKSSDK